MFGLYEDVRTVDGFGLPGFSDKIKDHKLVPGLGKSSFLLQLQPKYYESFKNTHSLASATCNLLSELIRRTRRDGTGR